MTTNHLCIGRKGGGKEWQRPNGLVLSKASRRVRRGVAQEMIFQGEGFRLEKAIRGAQEGKQKGASRHSMRDRDIVEVWTLNRPVVRKDWVPWDQPAPPPKNRATRRPDSLFGALPETETG